MFPPVRMTQIGSSSFSFSLCTNATVIAADGTLHLRGRIVKPDGSEMHHVERHGQVTEAAMLGRDAGLELKRRGGPGFLA